MLGGQHFTFVRLVCKKSPVAPLCSQSAPTPLYYSTLPLQELVDLVGLYRVFNPQYQGFTVFGQDFLAKHLLGWDTDGKSHDAVGDAIKSIQLFKLHQQLVAGGGQALADAQVGV